MVYKLEPSSETLGCSIYGMDLSKPFGKPELGFVLQALAAHGVVCFPEQSLDPAAQVAFTRQFGTLEVHVSGAFQEPGYPEMMILSNIEENGRPCAAHPFPPVTTTRSSGDRRRLTRGHTPAYSNAGRIRAAWRLKSLSFPQRRGERQSPQSVV